VIALPDIERRLTQLLDAPPAAADAGELLGLAEDVLGHWVSARGETPTLEQREGFRLLALHRQGARDLPEFNACRETCRELVYHYNLLTMHADDEAAGARARMMALLANHLYLFVSGKLQVARLGEFCCASRPLRAKAGGT
jgi:hypothetical protein